MLDTNIIREVASAVYENIERYPMDIPLGEFDELVQGAAETLEESKNYVKKTPSHRRKLD